MENIESKIKFTVKADNLQVLRALTAEFTECGKVSGILLNSQTEHKNLKLTELDFICVYKGLLKALSSNRYPHKKGNEYKTVLELKVLFETIYSQQRNHEINL